jgi:hypothetical protein
MFLIAFMAAAELAAAFLPGDSILLVYFPNLDAFFTSYSFFLVAGDDETSLLILSEFDLI